MRGEAQDTETKFGRLQSTHLEKYMHANIVVESLAD